jgi:hypothetical protein
MVSAKRLTLLDFMLSVLLIFEEMEVYIRYARTIRKAVKGMCASLNENAARSSRTDSMWGTPNPGIQGIQTDAPSARVRMFHSSATPLPTRWQSVSPSIRGLSRSLPHFRI